jgi:GDP-L-fucose synthase
MNTRDRVYVVGHLGLVGSAIVRRLQTEGFEDLLLRSREELDLSNGRAVRRFFEAERPSYVFLAAGLVGGIRANSTRPADFIRENLSIAVNAIDAAHRADVRKLLFLGSSCIYPRHAPQPIREEYLLTGPLEPTNESYAVAKIAGVKMCEAYRHQHGADFISVMPTNVYGPGDKFDSESGHVLPTLIRRFHEARESGAASVIVWGSGRPRREFLHVDDLADACVFLMRNYSEPGPVNVGVGKDISIAELANLVRDVVGYEGEVVFDPEQPDGTPRKLLDVSRLDRLGWRAGIELREGIERTYRWLREHLLAVQDG